MNISLNWLKEYANIPEDIDIKEITERLTMSGSKVEKYIKFGEKTENVFTGKVESVDKIDDNYSALKLNLGSKVYSAVAKIPDISIGDIVPVALPGAKLVGKEVKSGEVKGLKSECMVCHILDLGLNKELFPIVKSSGLICFPNDVKIGEDVSNLLGLGDYIIEFEITPNRTDCLSVEGIAREFGVTFGVKCAELWQDKKNNFKVVNKLDGVGVVINSDSCKKYVMNVIKNVEIKPSSFNIQLKLIKSGYSVINNIVDITNFVMLEMGQPLHAFDKNVLDGDIIVRNANENEKIITLDKTERVLNLNNMVISDSKKAVAVAGVMGGLDSGISDTTKTVIIESANFVRGSVRNTSKRLGLRTDASSKYEKGLAPELTITAMNRVCNLINASNSGNIEYNIVEVNNYKKNDTKIKLDYNKINNIIGTNLEKNDINNILNSLNLKVQDDCVNVPYYRADVEIIEDVAEEIARIYGYDKLPSTMPNTMSTFGVETKIQKFENRIKELALASGFNEIYTYTFFSKDTLNRFSDDKKLYDLVKLRNPLSKDFEFMRSTTVAHMLEALEKNNLKRNEEARLFELGKIFLNSKNIESGKLCDEKQILTFGIYNNNIDFYDLKEVVMSILNNFKIEVEISRSSEKYLHPGISADLSVNGKVIASIGKINPKVIQNYNLNQNTYIATLDVEEVFKNLKKEIKYIELPKFPAVERDIAFVINENVLSAEIIKEIKNINKNIVEDVKLFDVYQGNQIDAGKKSMAYRIKLRNANKTLEDNEIIEFMNKLFDVLNNKFKAEIRK